MEGGFRSMVNARLLTRKTNLEVPCDVQGSCLSIKTIRFSNSKNNLTTLNFF